MRIFDDFGVPNYRPLAARYSGPVEADAPQKLESRSRNRPTGSRSIHCSVTTPLKAAARCR